MSKTNKASQRVPVFCLIRDARLCHTHARICLLQIDNWNTFNVFQVGTMSRGSPLETVTLALFARHDLLDKLKIPYDRLRLFVRVSQDYAAIF